MKDSKPIKEQDTLDESVELSSQEKLEGQVRCLHEMNKILKSDKHKQSMMSTYIFVSPDGIEFLHLGMADACKTHGLNCGSVKNSLTQNRMYKGWKITHGK